MNWQHFHTRLLAVWLAAMSVASTGNAEEPVDYLREIKPLLQEKCFSCHGALKQEGGLRLDTAAAVRQGGDSGAAIAVGDPSSSLLLQRVIETDPSQRMPLQATPLTSDQIASIGAWIEQGATGPQREEPERDPREHWAFRPPVRPPIPKLEDSTWPRNPIDFFIAGQHEQRGLNPVPPASREHLLRRVFLDLIGLPPTVEEQDAFLADDSPWAYERVVERLLASPRYGERWGRHWMDVWRYADWYGRRNVPDVWNSAPQIWRWRDWIVRSLNEDKGYDRMLAEMLAADEIAPEDDETLVATGFLVRNWYALNPNDWMRQNVEHTAKAFLGLTFHCAHCHDHKYDPISQRDYFALRAFFEPIGIRQDRVAGEADPGPFQEYSYSVLRKVVRLGLVRVYDKNPDAPTWFYSGGDERNRQTEFGTIRPGVPAVLGGSLSIHPMELSPQASYPGLKPAIQDTVVAAARAAVRRREAELDEARAAAQATLPGLLEQWSRDFEDFSLRRAVEQHELKVVAADAQLVAENAALASVAARIAADTSRYEGTDAKRADALAAEAHRLECEAAVRQAEAEYYAAQQQLATLEAKPASDDQSVKDRAAAAKKVADALVSLGKTRTAEADPKQGTQYSGFSPVYPKSSTGRRRALAEWLGDRRNPLTSRVAVNHVWMRHFHSPLVPSVFDFGRNGSPPSHPELLDWLAVEFMESGWSMTHLHRLIVTSASYQLSSAASNTGDNARIDPENRLLWRQNVGRMEAEVVRDSLLACQEAMDFRLGGQELENAQALTTNRRSLYYSCQPELDGKSELSALFDAPDALDCYRRSRTIVPQQALALSNSELVHHVSTCAADQIWTRLDVADRSECQPFVIAGFRQVLSRSPTSNEIAACVEFLGSQNQKHGQTFAEDAVARASLIRVLLNHNDFVTVR